MAMYTFVILGHLDPPLLLEQSIRLPRTLLLAHVSLDKLAVVAG